MNVLSRIKRLEAANNSPYADVLMMIRQGRYFDELTDDERRRYVEYFYNTTLETFETVMEMCAAVSNEPPNYHFVLEKRAPPKTEIDEETRREVEALVNAAQIAYNQEIQQREDTLL